MRKMITVLTVVSFLFSLFVPLNLCGAEEKVIKEIKILGNIRVSKSSVLNKIKTHEGDFFDAQTSSKDIKRIFQMGFFSNVKIDIKEEAEGVIVYFIVTERPLLETINIRGNKKLKTKKIVKKLVSKEKEILNEKDVMVDIKTIKELYFKKGYMGTEVEYEIDEDAATNRAILNIKIREGGKVKIKRIYIKGCQAVKEKKVLKIMKTRKKSLFYSGKFEEEKFKDDLDRIKAFYYTKGFLDIKIIDVKQEFKKQGRLMYITISIEEGTTYNIGTISVSGNELFPTAEITKDLKLKKGDKFLPENMRKDIETVKNYYMEKGYIDVKVIADTKLDKEKMNLDVIFRIKENELSYINEIKIIGNRKTKDMVIRREFNIYPGEIFDGLKIKRSLEKLENIGFFKKVDKTIAPTEVKDKKDLIIEVEEDKTGELGFGAGYSSVDRLIGFVEIAQKNFDYKNFPYFTGAGQKLRFRSEFGKYRKDFILSFTEPWFLGRRLAFGFDIYSRDSSYLSSDFDERRKGFNLRLGKPLTEFVRADVIYTYEQVEIYNIADSASQYIKNEAGEKEISKIALDINRDTRDSFLLPTRGNKMDVITEVSGLGGDVNYVKLIGIYDQYIPVGSYFSLLEGHVIEFYFRAGVVKEYGDSSDVPIFDKFFLGGGAPSMRGFDYRDVSPRDELGEPIGGKTAGNVTLEYTFPIVDRIRGALFFDAGNVFSEFAHFELNNINAAAGVGVKIHLPIGPIRLDYGIPVKKDENNKDAKGRFTFNIGTVF